MNDVAPAVEDGNVHDQWVDPERLRAFAYDVFVRLGMDHADAELLADYFLWADLRGLPFVGIRRLPEFVGRLRSGGTEIGSGQGLTILHERAAFAVVDAKHTFAQIAGVRSMRLAMEKARSAGVGVVVVRNTTSAGALGHLAMVAADGGMVGMAINNTAPVVAPWGGSTGVMGAQPFAVSSPAGRHPPLLLDMTNTAMSMVRMHEYERRGEPIPEGAALAADGRPTTDPATAIRGVLLPAGHRAYGLAVLWEVISGVLAGGEIFGGDVGLPGQLERPMGVSLYLMAVDPTAAMPYDTFTARVDQLIDQLHDSPTASGADSVKVPGERSQATARVRRTSGIPIPADVAQSLAAMGADLGVPW